MKRASTLACSVAVVCGWTAACSVSPAACRPIPFQEIAPAAAQAVADPAAVWITQTSGVTVSLRGLSVVDGQTAWTSGEKGTVIRTSDGGRTWVECSIADARALDFRDLHAFDDRSCVAVNAGSPGCVYRTDDGGEHWTCVYRNESPTIFFDALSFCGPRGWALSDPQDGRFFLITSDDGGKHWQPHPSDRSPAADGGEACFAASGSSLLVAEGGFLWIGTGGERPAEGPARVLRSRDGGESWTSAELPMPANASSGVFSLAFANNDHGVAVGGDYQQPDGSEGNVALTDDGGAHWRPIAGAAPSGYRSAVAVFQHEGRAYFVAVGPNGCDLSDDWGNRWTRISSDGFHACSLTADGTAGWAVGSQGRVARWQLAAALQQRDADR